MANRKSSITAELKLSGAATFKSSLRDIEGAVKKTGKAIQAVRPPDISLTPQYQYWQARARGEKTLTDRIKAEDDRRAKSAEMAAQRSLKAFRTVASGLKTIQMQAPDIERGSVSGQRSYAPSRNKGGGWGATGGAAIGYNAVQDLVQGGPMAIANNIPQIIDLVSKSPALKNLGMVAIAGAASYGAAELFKYGYDRTFGHEANAMNRYGANRTKAYQARRGQSIAAGGREGEAAGAEQAAIGTTLNQTLSDQARRGGMADREREAGAGLRGVGIDAIEDPVARARAIADEEKRIISERIEIENRRVAELIRTSAQEQAAAESGIQAIKDEIKELTKLTYLDNEAAGRKSNLESQMPGAQQRFSYAEDRSRAAIAAQEELQSQEKISKLQKETIDAKRDASIKAINSQRDSDAAEGRAAWDQTYQDVRSQKKAIDKDLADKEKGRQETRDGLSSDVAMSKMSPRKRAKAEEAAALKSDVDEFRKQGFSKEEAEKMAGDKAGLRKPRTPGRTRGAGYGGDDSKRKSGLGSASYDGLAGLAAMQDDMVSPSAPQERKRIGGAGRDKEKIKEREDGKKEDSGGGIWGKILTGLQAVEKAIRDTGPSSNTRTTPTSTTSR